MKTALIKALIVLIPTYITAYLTNKMVYVVPMLAAASFVAASVGSDNTQKRIDGDKEDADNGTETDADGD
jgi:uncharacterized membrane protein|tara:strand:+ start:1050 stop:1259 length:210 start_codon:yes stop_codon:yes gene_type:complete